MKLNVYAMKANLLRENKRSVMMFLVVYCIPKAVTRYPYRPSISYVANIDGINHRHPENLPFD